MKGHRKNPTASHQRTGQTKPAQSIPQHKKYRRALNVIAEKTEAEIRIEKLRQVWITEHRAKLKAARKAYLNRIDKVRKKVEAGKARVTE